MPKRAVDSCLITVLPEPEYRHTHLVVSGEIDMNARPLFAATLRQVTDAEPRAVVVDLAPITFAGSVLANFLIQVRESLPASSALVLCRPAPVIHRVLQATGITQVASVHSDIPLCSCCPPADQQEGDLQGSREG